jgi:hypothetical protein
MPKQCPSNSSVVNSWWPQSTLFAPEQQATHNPAQANTFYKTLGLMLPYSFFIILSILVDA